MSPVRPWSKRAALVQRPGITGPRFPPAMLYTPQCNRPGKSYQISVRGPTSCHQAKKKLDFRESFRNPKTRNSCFPNFPGGNRRFDGQFGIGRLDSRSPPGHRPRSACPDPHISDPGFGRNPIKERPTATSGSPTPRSCRPPLGGASPKSRNAIFQIHQSSWRKSHIRRAARNRPTRRKISAEPSAPAG